MVATVGQHDLAIALWTTTVDDVQGLEVTIGERMSGAQIVEGAAVLRSVPLLARLLDATGAACRFVPLLAYLTGGPV